MAKKVHKRPRTERRAAKRRHDKLVGEIRRLEALEPGASPAHPIEVRSAAQIDPHARSLRCRLCDRPLFIADQRAYVRDGRVHRSLDLECRQCGRKRVTHFAIVTPLEH